MKQSNTLTIKLQQIQLSITVHTQQKCFRSSEKEGFAEVLSVYRRKKRRKKGALAGTYTFARVQGDLLLNCVLKKSVTDQALLHFSRKKRLP